MNRLIKNMLVAVIATPIVLIILFYLAFVIIILSGALSYEDSVSKKIAADKLLVSSRADILDLRAAIADKGYDGDEKWTKLYRYPVAPPLDTSLSTNETLFCEFVRGYEDRRTRFADPHWNGVSLLLPLRVARSALPFARRRGSSTAFQSSVDKLFGDLNKIDEIHSTAKLAQLPEAFRCRLIISAPEAVIVKDKKNYQIIRGGYAMSETIFKKTFDELDACELAFISTAFRVPLRWGSSQRQLNRNVYLYTLESRNLNNCPRYDILEEKLRNLDVADHPIAKSLKYQDLPLSIDIADFNELKKGILNATIRIEKYLKTTIVAEVAIKIDNEILRVDTLNRVDGFGEKHSPASLAKLLVAKSAIDGGEPATSRRLSDLFCHSNLEATSDLFDSYADRVRDEVVKYNFHYHIALDSALTSENAAWASADILNLAGDFVKTLNEKPKIKNAFGVGCTAHSLLSTIQPRHAIFAKTGTSSNRGRITAKLLLFAIKYTDGDPPAIVLIRIEGEDNKTGICAGSNCFNNKLLKHYLFPILMFTDKNQVGA